LFFTLYLLVAGTGGHRMRHGPVAVGHVEETGGGDLVEVTAVTHGVFPVSVLIGERLELSRGIKALPGWAYSPKR